MPLVPQEELEALQAELKRPLRQAFRINPLKVAEPAAACAAWSERYGWDLDPIPYCPNAYWVNRAQTPVSQTIEHRLGHYYIQDAASMLPVELFDFPVTSSEDGPLLLDLAASPGGKTTHLSARAMDRGLIIANDSSQDRITALRLVLQTWGSTSSAITHFPGERIGSWFPGLFDAALIDAPCSMQGLRTNESHPMRPISDKERDSLARRQAALLASALMAVRLGGQVVYSTCTLTPEEDEGVLEDILTRFGSAVEISDISQRLPVPAPALANYGGHLYPPEIQHAARLWPHRFGTAGFFAARLRRVGDLPLGDQDPPFRPLGKAGFEALPAKALASLSADLSQLYECDLPALLAQQRLQIWRREKNVYAFPDLFLERFSGLPVASAGLPFGEESPDGFLLAHEFLSRFPYAFPAGRLNLDSAQAGAYLRGEDLHNLESPLPPGRTVLICNPHGLLLGRARVQANRLKNLLPRRLISY
jgi:16S rRNA (cytosine1407-C5)-methyltransferase